MLPQMILHLEERHAVLVHVDCTHNNLWLVAHSLEAVVPYKSPAAMFAAVSLFGS